MLTVGELIKDLDVRLVAGEQGLELPVRWVHMSELLDPTPWLSGGEVLLTTGLQLDKPDTQREFITRLIDRQLAGIGFGIGFGFDEVPPALATVAAERDFPVFEVPYELPFIAVTEAAFTQLVNEQYAVLRRALAAQERLERIVLSERGLDALAGTLATLLAGSVLVLDARGELLVQHAFRRPVAADGAPAAMPSGAASVPQAWLVAIKDGEPLSDFDRLALRQAVTIIALELLRARVAGDTERRLAGDVLAAVPGLVASSGPLVCALVPGLDDGSCSRSPRASAGACRAIAGGASCSASVARSRRPRRGGPRGTLHARGGLAGRSAQWRLRQRRGQRAARRPEPRSCGHAGQHERHPDRHLSRPRELPAAALAAGRRGAAAVLRLGARLHRGERGSQRGRADALARGIHRGEWTVGAGGT